MATEHLPQLDAIATAASGKPTVVYLDDAFPVHLRGMADYSPKAPRGFPTYVIRLNPALLSWLSNELEEIFYHEVAHIRLSHVDTSATTLARVAGYTSVVQIPSGVSPYTTYGQVRREEEAEAMATRLRATWPFNAYRLWKLITGKEVFG